MKFRKFSAENIRCLLGLLPIFEEVADECQKKLIARRDVFFASDCLSPSWSHYYELSITEHLSCAITALDLVPEMKRIAEAPSQIEEVISVISEIENDNSEFTPDEKEKIRPIVGQMLGIATSVLRSLHCLMAYGAYLNELIAVARTGGARGDKAIVNAVRIDPTVLGTPTVVARLSQATLEDDKEFLHSIKRAINGSLSKQAKGNTDKIRFVLQTLRESGIEKFSDDELVQLFVEELNLYAATAKKDNGDTAKAIRSIDHRMIRARSTT